MNNKYTYMVFGGLFLMAWYYVGYLPFFAQEQGGISPPFMVDAMLILLLVGGKTDGDNLPQVLINSITSSIPKIISLSVALLVARGVWNLIFMGDDGYNWYGIFETQADLFASALLIIPTMACLKKANSE